MKKDLFTRRLKERKGTAYLTRVNGHTNTRPKMAKKRSRGRKLPKKGEEGNVKDYPHLPTLDWLVKNVLENPGTAGKSADRISA